MNRHAFCISIYNKVFKFRKWFKYGLMAQKFTEARPKGQEAHISSNALKIKQPIEAARPEDQVTHSSTPCFTLIEQALSAFFNVNYV